ncbi:hypothetical protein [Prevotella sp. KH2C16]|nr:hypothetical protein [Prevotella sp. KH2C16]
MRLVRETEFVYHLYIKNTDVCLTEEELRKLEKEIREGLEDGSAKPL